MAHKTKGWYSRGYLPHFDAPGELQHITYHLADSLPKAAIHRMLSKLDSIDVEKRSFEQIKQLEALLDKGYGSSILGRPAAAEIVENNLLYGDGDRYRLLAWTIMPNHVHVLIEQRAEWPLAQVIKSWKSYTNNEIKKLGYQDIVYPFWQREYWDRYVRDNQHYHTVMRYIAQNPVEAGLVENPEDWPWGSARFLSTC